MKEMVILLILQNGFKKSGMVLGILKLSIFSLLYKKPAKFCKINHYKSEGTGKSHVVFGERDRQ
jgi:hypothetical protein